MRAIIKMAFESDILKQYIKATEMESHFEATSELNIYFERGTYQQVGGSK